MSAFYGSPQCVYVCLLNVCTRLLVMTNRIKICVVFVIVSFFFTSRYVGFSFHKAIAAAAAALVYISTRLCIWMCDCVYRLRSSIYFMNRQIVMVNETLNAIPMMRFATLSTTTFICPLNKCFVYILLRCFFFKLIRNGNSKLSDIQILRISKKFPSIQR